MPLRSFEAVSNARFNLREWRSSVAPVSATPKLFLFSTRSDPKRANFHGRLVCPHIGIEPDPPIASVMPAFTGYLAAHDYIRQGTYAFVIDRGEARSCKSELSVLVA